MSDSSQGMGFLEGRVSFQSPASSCTAGAFLLRAERMPTQKFSARLQQYTRRTQVTHCPRHRRGLGGEQKPVLSLTPGQLHHKLKYSSKPISYTPPRGGQHMECKEGSTTVISHPWIAAWPPVCLSATPPLQVLPSSAGPDTSEPRGGFTLESCPAGPDHAD